MRGVVYLLRVWQSESERERQRQRQRRRRRRKKKRRRRERKRGRDCSSLLLGSLCEMPHRE